MVALAPGSLEQQPVYGTRVMLAAAENIDDAGYEDVWLAE